jgi:predicted PhzF superfamily epimerase YddE/YHI9
MATLRVLRVFAGEGGEWGNPLGVFLDGAEVPVERRQAVATELGYSETFFVDDRARGACRIYTPASEIGFAGHPSVGTAWLLAREGEGGDSLHPPAGEVAVRFEGELTFISARPEWSPPWEMIRFGSAAAVDALDGPPGGREDGIYVWAWADEAAGLVRSRCFALAEGIGEDEATGSAALMLTAELDRPLRIHQGRGSVLDARPLGDGRAEVGGRVVLDEVREFALT